MDSKDAQIAELKARVAALEAALAAKEEPDYRTECCGHDRYAVGDKLQEVLTDWWPITTHKQDGKPVEGTISGAFHEALKLMDAEAADRKAHPEKYEADSEWDCSCMTPECCCGGCQTSEGFKEWCAMEKECGEEHRLPVRDFKKANRGPWGLERRIAAVEGMLERLKKLVAQEKAKAEPEKWRLATHEGDIVDYERELVWLRGELAKFPVTKVMVTVPVDPGTFSCALTPERALRMAVLTRHRGLGMTLTRDALRVGTQMKLGDAERLFVWTRDEDLGTHG